MNSRHPKATVASSLSSVHRNFNTEVQKRDGEREREGKRGRDREREGEKGRRREEEGV